MTDEPDAAADPVGADTKDWTWVLDRPCPECGFVAADVDVAALPTLVLGWAEQWLTVLTRPDVAQRPSPGVWSPLEYACHVRDVFTVFAGRVRLMLTQDSPEFDSWDQDATALAERYDLQDPAVVGTELAAAAAGVAEAFTGVTGPAWERAGLRSNGSHFTVDSIGRYFAHDVVHHLADVRV